MQTENVKPKKDYAKWIILVIISLVTVPVFAAMILNPVLAVNAYEPITPQAQENYNAARNSLCEAEKLLAQAKLMDVANGVEMEVDLNKLSAKREMDCNGF